MFLYSRHVLALGIACTLTLGGGGTIAHADSAGRKAAQFVSGTGTAIFVAAGALLPLFDGDARATQRTLRTADALLTSSIITEGLKHIVREKRPGNDPERTGFPSGHATAAFSIATMASHYHPRQAKYWYAGATLIALSRVKLRRHYLHDVIAGAAVGYGTAKLELKQRRGLLLFPFIHDRAQGGGGGISIGGTF